MPNKEEIAKGVRSKNGKRPAAKKQQAGFRFINPNITEDVKRRVAAWAGAETEVWGYVEDIVGKGYKLGISFDGKNDCYIASVTDRTGNERFDQACFTVRGATCWDALVRALGLHYAVAQEDWTVLEQSVDPHDLW